MKNSLLVLGCSLILANAAQSALIQGKVSVPARSEKPAAASSYSRGEYLPAVTTQAAEPAESGEESWIVVWAKPQDGPATFVQPKGKLEMVQQNKTFSPHVLPIQTGSTVSFPNLDPLYHNVFSYSQAKRFDLGRYQQGKSKNITFDKPGIVEVYCEIHETMLAYIVVVDTPYFVRADKDGSFKIDAPPGNYRLFAWIPNRSSEPKDLDLTAAGAAINFSF